MNETERREKENERCYLCSLLEAIKDGGAVDTRLAADDFLDRRYRRVYETILKQAREKITPTLATLTAALVPENIPGDFICDITTAVPGGGNISYYEKQIFEASKKRLLIKSARMLLEEAESGTDPDTAIKNFLPAVYEVTAARNEAAVKSAGELLNTTFPPIRWIIPGLIGEGLTMINGAPKIGKSWFVLNLAIAASSGGVFLGKLPAQKTDTLYLALEDTDRRVKNRLEKLQSPKNENLKITTQWRDGYIGLESYLKTNAGIGLVIIDTLARFAEIEDMNDYMATTNAMARLKRIADDLNIAVILIHHAKKTGQKSSGADWMESALGSTGLTGATDGTIFISRTRSAEKTDNTATLYATGRDAADEKYNLTLDLAVGGWAITDNAPEKTATKKTVKNHDPDDPRQGWPK